MLNALCSCRNLKFEQKSSGICGECFVGVSWWDSTLCFPLGPGLPEQIWENIVEVHT